MQDNSFEIKIEQDGIVTISTDEFSPELHLAADQFLATVETLMGGRSTHHHLDSAHLHHHTHQHQHQHS